MTTAGESGYAELRRRYWQGTKAPRAARMIRTGEVDGETVDVNWLLRHHTEEAIENDETWYRDYVDELLYYFSMLEVAAITGTITLDTLSERDRRLAIAVLTEPAVDRYYERHYPLLLPLLFRRRLSGDGVRSIESGNRFREFLNLSRSIEGNNCVDTFLWFLDGGTYRDGHHWVDIDDTIEALASADQMARLLNNSRGALARSVEGFRRFSVFCQEFDALLRALSSTPLIRDAFWHAHSYWFHRIRKGVGATMDKGVDNLLKAARSATPAGAVNFLEASERRALAAEVERHGSELKEAISRLTLRADVAHDAVYGATLSAFYR